MIERTFKFQEGKHTFRTVTLRKETELRIKTGFEENVYVQLEEGGAEISGMEMTKYFFYKLPRTLSIPIYSWGGCELKIVGPSHFSFGPLGGVSSFSGKEITWQEKTWQPNEDNPHYMHANIFALMETLRQNALVGKHFGPKLLILGAPTSGKSELARTFLNYSVKIGWPTAFIELDPERPETSVPGMITASVVSGEYLPVSSKVTNSTTGTKPTNWPSSSRSNSSHTKTSIFLPTKPKFFVTCWTRGLQRTERSTMHTGRSSQVLPFLPKSTSSTGRVCLRLEL